MKNYIKNNLGIIIVLAVAGFMRLYKISSYMEFLGDQGRDVRIVRKFLTNFDLMFIGPQTSIGNMYLGPLYYYLMAPFLLLFNYNPVGPAIMVVIFSILTTYSIHHIYIDLFKSKSFAIFASLLYAVSPVAIKYSNFSWNPNIMPFFSLLFFYLSYLIFYKNRYKLFPWLTVSFILALNSHYLALILIPIFIIYLLIFLCQNKSSYKKQISLLKRPVYLSLFILLLSLLPLILFDIKHNGQNVRAVFQFFTIRQTTVNLKLYKSIPSLYPLFNQINTRLLFAKIPLWGQIGSAIFLLSIITCLNTKYKYKRNYILVLIFFVTSLVGLGLYKQHVYDHYFALLFPILFILYSATLNILFVQKLLRPLSILLIAAPLYLSIKNNNFNYSPTYQLRTTQEITKLIAEQSMGQPFNLALLAKNNYDSPYRYLLELQKQPLFHLVDKRTDQLFVICEPHPELECFPEGNPLWDIAAFGAAHVVNQWQINHIKIFKMIPSL